MKGIILAGGRATRLYPVTRAVSKQLLPVYDKPMIYYPLSILMYAGIRDILIISTPKDLPRFKEVLGTGTSLGIHLSYELQENPGGIAQSILIGEKFIGKDSVSLILGDNIFYGNNMVEILKGAISSKKGATIFAYHVRAPQRYGVIQFDSRYRAISIEEKPKHPKSNWAVTGLYFYDNTVVEIAKNLKPSARGELEITDVNKAYLKANKLNVIALGRGVAWLDTGTCESLIDASMFIKTIEDRQGLKIGCIEEVAYRMGYIDETKLKALADKMPSNYGEYLKGVLSDVR